MDNLLPIAKVIEKAKAMGVDFGSGDPKIHLAYLTKLKILPQTIKRKVDGEILGCYPEDVVEKLAEVDQRKKMGWSLAMIARDDQPVDRGRRMDFALPFLIIGLILGYLVAVVNLKTITPTQNVALNSQVNAITKSQPGGSIYLISLPKGSLENLGGKINLNY